MSKKEPEIIRSLDYKEIQDLINKLEEIKECDEYSFINDSLSINILSSGEIRIYVRYSTPYEEWKF